MEEEEIIPLSGMKLEIVDELTFEFKITLSDKIIKLKALSKSELVVWIDEFNSSILDMVPFFIFIY